MPARFASSALLLSVAVLLACSPSEPATTDDTTGGTGTGETDATTTTGTPTTTAAPTSTSDTSTSDGTTSEGTTSPVDTTTDAETTTTTTGETTTGEATTGETTTGDETTTTTTGSTTDDTGETTSGTTGDEGLGPDAQAAIDALELVVDGVLWTSESDYPWTVFGLPDAAPIGVDNLKELLAPQIVVENGEAPLEEQTIEQKPWDKIFLDMTTPQDWWTDYEIQRAEQYQAIQDVLEGHLVNLKMFRIGEKSGNWLSGAIDMFVIGETVDGDLVGIQTITVET
ncbi:nuclease A inhibitor family protein [Nannocystis bainbridge]|uniref:Nuclease A inhibitor family protein n=1 Tax=Nannocystis bainbridge TaxID=2995303 RepID=A0ABT5E0F4_9BACT|nr:nuclease A inhibitor family protein [Nannocystis bainbridge]MDC0718903.1 nuclease A inhibitor family protein [Nannocystis bainbridge]